MTELGWSSTSGATCERGTWAGLKPSGVSAAAQAGHLRAAFHCLARDRYVQVAAWFTLQDDPAQDPDELRPLRPARRATARPSPRGRPSARSPPAATRCAARAATSTGPRVRVRAPVAGQRFTGVLRIGAVGRRSRRPGPHPPLRRRPAHPSTSAGPRWPAGARARLAGARRLASGRTRSRSSRSTAAATRSTRRIAVTKVDPRRLRATLRTRTRLVRAVLPRAHVRRARARPGTAQRRGRRASARRVAAAHAQGSGGSRCATSARRTARSASCAP